MTAITSQVMLIRPKNFHFNEQTAMNNSFQENKTINDTQAKAAHEFEELVHTLRNQKINVLVFDDIHEDTPDSIFPNNWISSHRSGELVIYPMFAKNRQKEVRQDIIEKLSKEFNYVDILNWTAYTEVQQFLEGTGSLVLDRKAKIAYACLSQRTDKELLEKWGEAMNYSTIPFTAVDQQNNPIYHTNVMMAMANEYAVICLECIADENKRQLVKKSILQTNKEIIEISYSQMNSFAGNMLELLNTEGESIIVMSQTAHDSLHKDQLERLGNYSKIVSVPITTIETLGGGSVRCMIAEIAIPETESLG